MLLLSEKRLAIDVWIFSKLALLFEEDNRDSDFILKENCKRLFWFKKMSFAVLTGLLIVKEIQGHRAWCFSHSMVILFFEIVGSASSWLDAKKINLNLGLWHHLTCNNDCYQWLRILFRGQEVWLCVCVFSNWMTFEMPSYFFQSAG